MRHTIAPSATSRNPVLCGWHTGIKKIHNWFKKLSCVSNTVTIPMSPDASTTPVITPSGTEIKPPRATRLQNQANRANLIKGCCDKLARLSQCPGTVKDLAQQAETLAKNTIRQLSSGTPANDVHDAVTKITEAFHSTLESLCQREDGQDQKTQRYLSALKQRYAIKFVPLPINSGS